MVHIFPKTNNSVFLLGGKDSNGLFKFFIPIDSKDNMPGLFTPLIARQFVFDQMLKAVKSRVELFERELELVGDFSAELKDDNGEDLVLYLVIAAQNALSRINMEQWLMFPQLLQKMSRNRNRLAYLKAWQYLTGGHKLETKAIETDNLNF